MSDMYDLTHFAVWGLRVLHAYIRKVSGHGSLGFSVGRYVPYQLKSMDGTWTHLYDTQTVGIHSIVSLDGRST